MALCLASRAACLGWRSGDATTAAAAAVTARGGRGNETWQEHQQRRRWRRRWQQQWEGGPGCQRRPLTGWKGGGGPGLQQGAGRKKAVTGGGGRTAATRAATLLAAVPRCCRSSGVGTHTPLTKGGALEGLAHTAQALTHARQPDRRPCRLGGHRRAHGGHGCGVAHGAAAEVGGGPGGRLHGGGRGGGGSVGVRIMGDDPGARSSRLDGALREWLGWDGLGHCFFSSKCQVKFIVGLDTRVVAGLHLQ